MLRDNLAGLIEPMLSSAGANPLALCTARKQSSDDRPPCLENPRPEGAESTLTENAASPFQAEPRQPCKRILRRGGLFVYPIPTLPTDTKPARARQRMRTLRRTVELIANVGIDQRSSLLLGIPDNVQFRFALSAFLHSSSTLAPPAAVK